VIDNTALVKSTLDPVGVLFSCPVIESSPESITIFPCVTFLDSGHDDSDFADGKAQADLVTVIVDIWEKADKETGIRKEVHQSVDAAMLKADWYKSGFAHLHEPSTDVHHYVQKYSKVEAQ